MSFNKFNISYQFLPNFAEIISEYCFDRNLHPKLSWKAPYDIILYTENGYGDGDGNGDGDGYGSGYRDGDGYGYGYRYGDGSGDGYGYGFRDKLEGDVYGDINGGGGED